eukprot:2524984-Alexandrium_andersonii.AAC.1
MSPRLLQRACSPGMPAHTRAQLAGCASIRHGAHARTQSGATTSGPSAHLNRFNFQFGRSLVQFG